MYHQAIMHMLFGHVFFFMELFQFLKEFITKMHMLLLLLEHLLLAGQPKCLDFFLAFKFNKTCQLRHLIVISEF